MTDNAPEVHDIDEGFLTALFDRLGVDVAALSETERDRIEDLLGRLLAEAERDDETLPEPTADLTHGQKTTDMTDETDRLADKIIERFEGDLQERLDEARRDDKGTPHGRLDDETNAVADDRGNRKRRRRGVPRSAVDELDDLTTDVDDPKAGITPDDPDGGDDDLDPRIEDAAGGEGW